MLWSRRANGIALTWGRTSIPETDFDLITRESPGFIHGECQIGKNCNIRYHVTSAGNIIIDDITEVDGGNN